ncbi:hypothetical protein GpartN1_g1890.t1 [Galdieria partita]|uniref:Uncharacterized protein n=1 Tax=Galdieria partita TaxID=83374 RepID=A0A9C7PTT7_9RHOD|nr:hypothetical protein GpartN1_g1890.t1 [Galdieria partita]
MFQNSKSNFGYSMNIQNISDDEYIQEKRETIRLRKLVDELYRQRDQAIQDAKQLAKALEQKREQSSHISSSLSTKHIACNLSSKILSVLANSDIIVIDFQQFCQPQVGKTLLPQVVFDSNYFLDDMQWKWFVSDEYTWRLVSTECFYIPNPNDVNQNLQVEWTRKLENDLIVQRFQLGKICLSSYVENLLMSFELMGRAIFTGLRNHQGPVLTMMIEKNYLSISHAWETVPDCNFHFDMKEIRIDCMDYNYHSTPGFSINSKYEFFVETRLELILIYCTIHMFALSADICETKLRSTTKTVETQIAQDKIERDIHSTDKHSFLKRFPFSRRKLRPELDSTIPYKPLQISRPIPETVWHAKEDMPRQTL